MTTQYCNVLEINYLACSRSLIAAIIAQKLDELLISLKLALRLITAEVFCFNFVLPNAGSLAILAYDRGSLLFGTCLSLVIFFRTVNPFSCDRSLGF